MIKWFICFVWGHKFMGKFSTGEQFDTHHRLYPMIPIKGDYYVWRPHKFCPRCGEPNPHYKE